jgi:hypothetical protein
LKFDTFTKWGFVEKRTGCVSGGNLRVSGTTSGILLRELWEINISSPSASYSLRVRNSFQFQTEVVSERESCLFSVFYLFIYLFILVLSQAVRYNS